MEDTSETKVRYLRVLRRSYPVKQKILVTNRKAIETPSVRLVCVCQGLSKALVDAIPLQNSRHRMCCSVAEALADARVAKRLCNCKISFTIDILE